MAKTERKYFVNYLNAKMPEATTDIYSRLGKDLEELDIDTGSNVETFNNILGETTASLTNYEPSGTVEPYYHDKTDALAERLQDMWDNRRVLDDCNSDMIEVHLWGAVEGSTVFPAVKSPGLIELTNVGGDTGGYRFSFNFHYTGTPVKGMFDVSTKTFIAD